MQLVDFALPFRVLDFPHPLFANHLHVNRIRRSSFDSEIDHRAPCEESKRKDHRSKGPAALNPKRTGGWIGTIGGRAAAIFNREKNNRQKNDGHEKKRDQREREEQSVHFVRTGGSLRRKKTKLVHADLGVGTDRRALRRGILSENQSARPAVAPYHPYNKGNHRH